MKRGRRLDLQAKITLILLAVILPTFLIVTVAQNKLTQPILEEEMRQVGITTARTLAKEIVSSRWLTLPNPTPAIENHIQELIYLQPAIKRIDVAVKDPAGNIKIIASNVEDDPADPSDPSPTVFQWSEMVTTRHVTDEGAPAQWEIVVPIEQKSRDPKVPKKVLGGIHMIVSLQLVQTLSSAVWRTTVAAAVFSVVTLLLVLSYLLRKTIFNDRLLRQAETANLQLTEQLHDVHRQLMNTEKLAVMGQLTASFAHEIGTPLNAIGGHLQLLNEEIDSVPEAGTKHAMRDRLKIVNGQVSKIEEIVKGFLQSTAKPSSQRQLVDLNQLAEKTLEIVRPRTESMHVEVKRKFDRQMGPVRLVPLELEQVLLNLVNNSLDSMRGKTRSLQALTLELATRVSESQAKQWAEISVYDTGEGIKKTDLENVLKPFFTTKPPGEGTGLGLTICQQLVHKYGGELEIDSKEGAWTRVTIRLPYHATA